MPVLNLSHKFYAILFHELISSVNIRGHELKDRTLIQWTTKDFAIEHQVTASIHFRTEQVAEQNLSIRGEPKNAGVPVTGPFDVAHRKKYSAHAVFNRGGQGSSSFKIEWAICRWPSGSIYGNKSIHARLTGAKAGDRKLGLGRSGAND